MSPPWFPLPCRATSGCGTPRCRPRCWSVSTAPVDAEGLSRARSAHRRRPHRRASRRRAPRPWVRHRPAIAARSGPASSMGMCIWTRRRPGRASPTRTARIPARRPPSSPIAPRTTPRPRSSHASSSACAVPWRTAPPRSARISTATGRTRRRTGRCSAGMRDAWAGRIDLQAVSICPAGTFRGR